MKKIAIVGAGGFGREVLMLIEHINSFKKTYDIIGFFDDGISKNTIINNYIVLGDVDLLKNWNEKLDIALAIGNPKTKCLIVDKLQCNSFLSFPNLIHPSVLVNNYNNVLGYGCLVCQGCIFTVNITLGNFVILNLACTVGHDTIIGDYCSIMPGVNVSGEVILESKVYIGTGAKIVNLTKIGYNSIIGAGSVVFKSIPENCTAVGVPAKPIKFHND